MNREISNLDDWINVGKAAKKIKKYAMKILSKDMLILDYIEKIEEKIHNTGYNLAFPINVSINEIAAHDTADFDDNRYFKRGDVVKVDLGLEKDGYISDTAFTIEIGSNKHKKIIKACEEALEFVKSIIYPGIKVCEIGKSIENIAQNYDFKVIRNLGGHSIERYNLHSGLFIPNFNNKDKRILKNIVIAVEPFFTYGVGVVEETDKIKIFSLAKKPRNILARRYYNILYEERNKLPFSLRYLIRRFGIESANKIISMLMKENSLYCYPVLREKSNNIVVQFEDTIIVTEDEVIVTTDSTETD